MVGHGLNTTGVNTNAYSPGILKRLDHRCGLGVMPLPLMQWAWVRSLVESISWLRFFSTVRQMSGNWATFIPGYHLAIIIIQNHLALDVGAVNFISTIINIKPISMKSEHTLVCNINNVFDY